MILQLRSFLFFFFITLPGIRVSWDNAKVDREREYNVIIVVFWYTVVSEYKNKHNKTVDDSIALIITMINTFELRSLFKHPDIFFRYSAIVWISYCF